MTTNEIAVAQEALAYLREETALAQTTPTAPATKAEKAVARIFDTVRNSFVESFDWQFARNAALQNATVSVTDASTWPALARSALALALARDLAVVITGRQEDLKTVAALFAERLEEAKAADIRSATPSDASTVEVLALLHSAGAGSDGEMYAVRNAATLLTSATNDVLAVQAWRNSPAVFGNLSALAQSAALALAAHKAASRFGAGAEGVAQLWQLYERRLRAARVRDLSETLDAATSATGASALGTIAKKVMRRVFPFVTGDDAQRLPYSLDKFVDAVKDASTAAENEVKATLGVSTLDALAEAAAEVLAASRVAPVLELDTGYATLRLQEYKEKILEWRRVAMDTALRSSADPVLAELIANESDDAAKARAFATYQSRVAAVKPVARDMILAAHHWKFARECATVSSVNGGGSIAVPQDCVRVRMVVDYDGREVEWTVEGGYVKWRGEGESVLYTKRVDTDNWPAYVQEAYVAAVAARLARAAGSGSRETLEQLAATRLRAARVADLNEDGSGSRLVKEVKNVLKAEFRVSDADLDESADELTIRIGALVDGARAEVMGAHNWHFAHTSCMVAAADAAFAGAPGAAAFQRPPEAVRITGVRCEDGRLAEWSVRDDGMVFVRGEGAFGRAFEVSYMRDVEDVDDWPADVRRALVYRIAADAAATVPRRDKDATLMLELYRQKLEAAKLADAREGNPGRSAWGHGRYVEAFRGGMPTRPPVGARRGWRW